MKVPQIVILALISIVAAFYVGLIDYETKSIWQLFNAENFPFMIFFSAFVFSLLNLSLWLISALSRCISYLLARR